MIKEIFLTDTVGPWSYLTLVLFKKVAANAKELLKDKLSVYQVAWADSYPILLSLRFKLSG
jgi:hypothetical protein